MRGGWWDLCLTALAPLTWGTTYLVATQTLPTDRPLLVGALRALPAGLLLLVVVRRRPKGRNWLRLLILGLLNIGLFFGLLFVAAFRLPGGVAATVGAVQPLVVALLAWLLLGQRPRPLIFLAAAGGLIGVAAIVLGPTARLDGLGLLAALSATVSMALGTVLSLRWRGALPVLAMTAWQLVFGGGALLLASLFLEGAPPALTGTNLLGVTYLTLVGTGLAYALWFRGLPRVGTRAAFLGLLSPVVAVTLGSLFLEERFRPLQLLGVLLVLGSLLLAQHPAARSGSAGGEVAAHLRPGGRAG